MKQVFSNKRIFAWILKNFQKFQPFLERIQNQEINPLLNSIEFTGPSMTPEKVIFAKKCLSLLPDASLIRGHCKQISFLPTIWFGKGSTPENPIIVTNVKDAESQCSLPCGYSGFMNESTPNVYEQKIELYDFPDYVNPKVIRVYRAYVILHEYAHTLGKPAFYWKHHAINFLGITDPQEPTYKLKFNGQELDPKVWHQNFILEALSYDPVTVYSGVYKDLDSDERTHEYFADYVATYFIRIALNPRMVDHWGGLIDCPGVKKRIEYFLNAEALIVA